MSLERTNIVRSDFPVVRRGLDPEAVQKHLASVADEIERLQSELASAQAQASQARTMASSGATAVPPSESTPIATQASRRVETIVAAAEASAPRRSTWSNPSAQR